MPIKDRRRKFAELDIDKRKVVFGQLNNSNSKNIQELNSSKKFKKNKIGLPTNWFSFFILHYLIIALIATQFPLKWHNINLGICVEACYHQFHSVETLLSSRSSRIVTANILDNWT